MMKISARSLGITAWMLLTLVLLNGWRATRWELTHVSMRMAEVRVVDKTTAATVANFTVDLPPLSTPFRKDWQRHIISRPENGFFVLAQIGDEPLRATVRAPGYTPVEMDLGTHAFSSEPVLLKMERKPAHAVAD